MDKGKWWDRSWNPVLGCSKISPGCKNCYAEKLAATRLKHLDAYKSLTTDGKWNGKICEQVGKLGDPLSWWKKGAEGRRVFVCDMGDLFHENVTFHYIAAVYGVMAARPDITFIVLTKRPERMVAFMKWARSHNHVSPMAVCELEAFNRVDADSPVETRFPPRNVWHGTTVEDQKRANERIPWILQVPSSVRFLSVEPLLEHIDFLEVNDHVRAAGLIEPREKRIDWAIVGGESGTNARQCSRENIEHLVWECKRVSMPCYVKQFGSRYVDEKNGIGGRFCRPDESMVGKIRRLKEFAGRDMSEWPESLRIRQFPGTAIKER